MKQVVLTAYGSTGNLVVQETTDPVPSADQVLVRIKASSVNPVDWKICQGQAKLITGWKFPRPLGADFAGIILSAPSQDCEFQPGDRVFGMVSAISGGAYAEKIAVHPRILCPIPDELSFELAATIPLAAQTALQSIRDKGKLTSGGRILVNGTSSGVGHFGVQIARAMGARVTGICGTRNLAFSSDLGCEEVIDYTQTSIDGVSGQFDLFFDAVAKMNYSQIKHLLAPAGTYVTTVPSGRTLLQQTAGKIFGRPRVKNMMVKSNRKDLDFLMELYNSGQLSIHVGNSYPLEEIHDAHQESIGGHVTGKLSILIPDS